MAPLSPQDLESIKTRLGKATAGEIAWACISDAPISCRNDSFVAHGVKEQFERIKSALDQERAIIEILLIEVERLDKSISEKQVNKTVQDLNDSEKEIKRLLGEVERLKKAIGVDHTIACANSLMTIEELQKENSRLDEHKVWLHAELEKVREESQRYRTALEFYADTNNYDKQTILTGICGGEVPIDCQDKDGHVKGNFLEIGNKEHFCEGISDELQKHEIEEPREWGIQPVIKDFGKVAKEALKPTLLPREGSK